MKNYTEKDIQQWMEDNFRIWNARDRAAFTKLYEEAAPNGLIIEYVGQPEVEDGWAAFNYMWDNYNQNITAEPQQILVNGKEAAVYVFNISKADGNEVHPSIETYTFDNGTLTIRYFHKSEHLV